MITALLFDFDGLILDTETPEYTVWQALYREHGHELPAETWGQIVGGTGGAAFDAAQHLDTLSGGGLDVSGLRHRHQQESLALIRRQPLRPGVQDYLREAELLRLKLAVASSSPHAWVDGHLKRLGLFDRFGAVVCAEDVLPGRTKPHPDLFLAALRALQAAPGEALIFEDSPNGVRAGRAAGVYTVAVPNPLTRLLPFEGCDLTLDSMQDRPLAAVIAQAQRVR